MWKRHKACNFFQSQLKVICKSNTRILTNRSLRSHWYVNWFFKKTYEAKHHDANLVIAPSTITNLITLKSRNSITALFQRAGSCGSPAEPRKYYVTPPRNREKFRESGNGGGGQNKIRKKVERLVVAFKRVAKKFHRRMETLVAHRRALPTLFFPRLHPFVHLTATLRPAQQSVTLLRGPQSDRSATK